MKRQRVSYKKVVAVCLLAALAGCASGDVYFEPNMDFGSVQTIAVLPFQNLSNMDEAAQRVRDTFIVRLLATGAVYVLPSGEVARGMSKIPRVSPEGPSGEQIKQLGIILGAESVITGVIREYGTVRSGSTSANVVSLSLQMIDVSSGLVVWSASSTKGGVSVWDRLVGGGGDPMDKVTVKAVDELLDKLFD